MVTPVQFGAQFSTGTGSVLAKLADGGFVTAYTVANGDALETRGQIYDANRQTVGDSFLMHTSPGDTHAAAALAGLPGGGFVSVWSDDGSDDADDTGLRGQIFAADGALVGDEFGINTETDYPAKNLDVTALSDGRIVVVWDAFTNASGRKREAIFMQTLNANGTKAAPGIILDGYEVDDTRALANVATLADGGFVVAWQDGGESTSEDARVQIFDTAGVAKSDPFDVNTRLANYPEFHRAEVAGLDDGRFVVVFYEENSPSPDGDGDAIVAQVVNADGTLSGPPILVNTTAPGNQREPEVAAIDGGMFVVTWADSYTNGDTAKRAVRGQAFANDGQPIGEEFNITNPGNSAPLNKSITPLGDGRFVTLFNNGSAKLFEIGRFFVDNDDGNEVIGTPRGDILYGMGGNDTMEAGSGDDRIYGGDGDDEIDGGSGEDYIRPGAGADTVDGGEDLGAGDRVSYWNTDGAVQIDLTAGTATGGYAEGDVLNLIEDLSGGRASDTLTGDGKANSLLGHEGNDTIKAMGGDDYVRGNLGADNLDGGDGARDRISYWKSEAGVTVDFTDNANNAGGEAEGDLLAGFEDLSGSNHDDFLTTDDNDNRIAGHDGDDTIKAGGGNDFIRGGAGADDIDGGEGDDDIASYYRSTAGVSIQLATSGKHVNGEEDEAPTASTANGGFAEGDMLVGIEHLYGTQFRDTLIGNEENNLLRSYAGSDTLRGKQGDDTLDGGGRGLDQANESLTGDLLDGGEGFDYVSYERSNKGVDVVVGFGNGVGFGGHAQDDQLIDIEGVLGSQFDDAIRGSSDDALIGNAGDDFLRMRTGNNTLNGGDGDDTLTGGNSVDLLIGGSGDDSINGGAGADMIDGQDGFDIVSYADSTAGVTVDASNSGAQTGGTAEGDVLSNIEHIIGSDHDDVLTSFNQGQDPGPDFTGTLFTLDGGDGNDLLITKSDFTLMRGGDGDDTLSVGGNTIFNELFGGAGSDRFEIQRNYSDSIIRDYDPDEDVIVMDLDDGVTKADLESFSTDRPDGVVLNLFDLDGGVVKVDGVTFSQLIDDLVLI
ncbi:calcium-binding protein [Rhodobacteraceae bacterium KMM 6894]|nr:calcium-binding protein [Rhodobacteraceae bacterium KMM 6894]